MSNFLTFLRSKKYFVILLAAIVLFFLLRTVLLQTPNTELTYTLKQENLVDSVQVSGTYTTASQIAVTAPTNGVIDTFYISNTDEVKKGDPLFHIQSTATVDQQKTAYANYLSAISALQTAQQNKTGFQSQLEQDRQAVITASSNVDIATNRASAIQPNPATGSNYSQNDLNAIKSILTSTRETFSKDEQKYLQSDTPISAAQAQVATTKQLYDETQSVTVTAPVGGTVVNLLAKIGDQVTAPQPLTTPTPVLVVANLGDPYITAEISEDYALRIAQGQKVYVVFDALKDTSFSGTVENLDTVGTNSQGVITYQARITAENIPASIKPNMTALITIETLRKDNIIDVPNSAVVTTQNMSSVEEAKTHKRIPVTLGIHGVTKTEITSGLSPGTTIIANLNTN